MNKKIGNIFKGDKVIWMVFFFLCMISIVEVFSASSNLTYKSQNYIGPIAFHTVTILIGALTAVITLNIPCRYFKLMTPFLLIISGEISFLSMCLTIRFRHVTNRWNTPPPLITLVSVVPPS